MACICADGTAISPGLIYESSSGNIQDSWVRSMTKDDDIYVACSPSGWSNNNLALAWLRDVFDPATKAKAGRSWRLLIADGHGSHLTMKFIDYCICNRILLAIYPPHSTHALQPLDVVMFSPLAAAYSKGVNNLIYKWKNLISMHKGDFYGLFIDAWRTTLTKKNILKAFEATGLLLFDRSVVIKKIAARHPKSRSRSRSLSPSSYRHTDRLLKQAAPNRHGPVAERLREAIHEVTTHFELIRNELEGISGAFIHEKKSKKREKPLPLQESHGNSQSVGGGRFWSPGQVNLAKAELERQECEESYNELKKLEDIYIQNENKLLAAKEREKKAAERAAVKASREQAARSKAAKDPARRTTQRPSKASAIAKKKSHGSRHQED